MCDSNMQDIWEPGLFRPTFWFKEDQGHDWGSGSNNGLKQLVSSIWDLEPGMCEGWGWMEDAGVTTTTHSFQSLLTPYNSL